MTSSSLGLPDVSVTVTVMVSPSTKGRSNLIFSTVPLPVNVPSPIILPLESVIFTVPDSLEIISTCVASWISALIIGAVTSPTLNVSMVLLPELSVAVMVIVSLSWRGLVKVISMWPAWFNWPVPIIFPVESEIIIWLASFAVILILLLSKISCVILGPVLSPLSEWSEPPPPAAAPAIPINPAAPATHAQTGTTDDWSSTK